MLTFVIGLGLGLYVGKYGTSHLVALWKALVAKFKNPTPPPATPSK